MTETTRTFTPDWVSPPGDTIADILEERDWTQVQLAERLGYTTKHISQLINGKAPINEETALKLERVLGSTTAFWLSREAQYRAGLARIEEENRLKEWTSWLDQLPVKELMNQGAISKCILIAKNKPGVVKNLLHFFGVASPEDWQKCYGSLEVNFRRTREEQSDVGAISAWLRLGEIEAEKLDCPKYSKPKFEKAVQEIRTLTVLPRQEFEPQMQQLCREAGVVLVLVPSIKRSHVSGVARWLNSHKALIQLSLYGKTNDRFWFNFFHEAAHILLHDKENIFLDEWDSGESLESEPEREANQWAREFLIPPEYEGELTQLKSKNDVVDFAKRIGIHHGIVVGRLQHDKLIPLSWMNAFKESFSF
ncbi:helix-turn-helix domain-containing protein [Nostoc sp. FACHB-87]|uniref:helix-turn-helix domain-containing protein n=1 Tax=Nostocaceae TaxID=1162 RepID=UPI001689162B|nr:MULTISPECIES: helix-turn-helix domain-containing protein [Nostocaceae]MBD2455218.1 helix-turn-helix domain-containing protein [Nostoc sp. FACHB-87]MBD2476957.1 helix-turn-helix domain-containing protein [Anabaena sp. FACHB-83]